MHIVTTCVFPDEPCHGLWEGPEIVPGLNGSLQPHWLQKVFVIRSDAIAKYITDFGPALAFDGVTPLLIPSFGENSVAQLQEIAEKHRHNDYWTKRREEMLAESTLIEDAIRQHEQDREMIRQRSVLGPGINVQRNGYSHRQS